MMCSSKVIKSIDNGEAILIKKIHLYITVAIILVSFTTTFAITKKQVDENTAARKKSECDHALILEIQANVKQLVNQSGLKYIIIEKGNIK